jgi:hypothetical protein
MNRPRLLESSRPASGAAARRLRGATVVAVALLLGGGAAMQARAAAYGAPVQTERVEVSYRDATQLTELRRIPITANESTAWIDDLSRYVATQGSRVVPAGQRLTVTIDDVQRAGGFEPGRPGQAGGVRVVRDSSPPRIDLSFKLESAQGQVLKEGDRQLRDANFMNRSSRHRGDKLAYEKNLIDDWMRKEFPAPKR